MQAIKSCLLFASTFLCALAPSAIAQELNRAAPYTVGALTTQIEGLKVELWYPSLETADPLIYDIRNYLPPSEARKIPDSAEPYQTCDCAANLALAPSEQPLPLVIMVHGTAGFRTASLSQATYLASQGYIVLAADHPAITLKDILGNILSLFRADQKADVEKMLAALRSNPSKIHPILAQADLNNIALIGHSAGGGAVSSLGRLPGVKAVVSMAAGGAVNTAPGVFALVMGAVDDQVSSYSAQQKAYARASAPKAFIGLSRAGHLAFTDICSLMPSYGGILSAAINFGVRVPDLVARLGRDGCGPTQLAPTEAVAILNAALGEVLDASLKGQASTLAALPAQFPAIQDFDFQP